MTSGPAVRPAVPSRPVVHEVAGNYGSLVKAIWYLGLCAGLSSYVGFEQEGDDAVAA